jgi:sec-independent protein translocase protein TatC
VFALSRVEHEDRLSVVDHLDELRTRLLVSLAAVAVAFGLCVWQNHALLQVVNKPLQRQTQKAVRAVSGPPGASFKVQQSAHMLATQLQVVVSTLERPGSGASAAARQSLRGVTPRLRRAATGLSAAPAAEKPVTLGISEPFTTTMSIALMFALIFALPVVLYQLYSFVLPAFSPHGQRSATPLILAIPVLFITGVSFGYFVVLPAALRFFQNFNSSEFNVLVQAGPYYHFAGVTLLAMGLLFQVPVAVLAATRAEVVSVRQLRHNRRYALLACGLVAALLPGDATTLILETVPLYLLFELSLLVAAIGERHAARREPAVAGPTYHPPTG